MNKELTQDILVITPTVTHPQNAGNRVRVYRMLKELQNQGHRIHLVYDGSERNAGHVSGRQDLAAMRNEWDSFYYVPNQASIFFQHHNQKDRTRLHHAYFLLWCRVGDVLTPGWLSVNLFDNVVGKIGRMIRFLSPGLYRFLKPSFPEGRFHISLEHLAREYQAPHNDIDKRYPTHLDDFLLRLQTNQTFDVVLVEYVFMSKALESFDASVHKLIDTHDVFTNRDELFHAHKLHDAMFSTTAMQEKKGLERADAIIAIQDEEREYFSTLVAKPIYTIGHHVPIADAQDPGSGFTIAFVGAHNSANEEAITRFRNEILPKLRSIVPDAHLLVAGSVSNVVPDGPGCTPLGEVKDLAEVYSRAHVVINPACTGTGLKIKCIEALGFGKPLVVSSHAAKGLQGAQWARQCADTNDEWVAVLTELAESPSSQTDMSQASHDFARDNNKLITETLSHVVATHQHDTPKPNADTFTLFTWPRAGASTLSTIFKQHPDIRVWEEPFHRTRGMALPPNDIVALRSALARMWQTHNGIKHNWGLSENQTKELLLHPNNKIIFLWRKNALQREVSLYISQQSNYWNSTQSGRETLLAHTFDPIDVSTVRTKMNAYLEDVARYQDLLATNDKEYFLVTYEELYGPDRSFHEKVKLLHRMLAFIDKKPFTAGSHLHELARLFDPDRTKLNTHDTYRKIPNIDEVEAQLGSDETGWLFR